MIFAATDGTRRATGTILTTDTETVIIDAVPAGQKVTVDSIWVSCDATGTAISIWWSDGTNDFPLYQAKPVSANDRLAIENLHLPLRQGWSLKCQASDADHLTVTTVVIDGNANKGANTQ